MTITNVPKTGKASTIGTDAPNAPEGRIDGKELLGSLKEKALLLNHLEAKGLSNGEVEQTKKQLGEIIQELETFGAGDGSDAPVGKYGLTIKKAAKDEYLSHFKPVVLPPSAIEAKALFPSNKEDQKASIEEAKVLYGDYLDMFTARKNGVEKALKLGRAAPADVEIMKQLLAKLDDAISFTEKQIGALDKYEGDL